MFVLFCILYLLSQLLTPSICFNTTTTTNHSIVNQPTIAIGVYQDLRVFIDTIPSLKKFIINPLLSYGYSIELFVVLACRHVKQEDYKRAYSHVQFSLEFYGISRYVTLFEFYAYGEAEEYVKTLLQFVEQHKRRCENPCRELFQQYYMRNKLNIAINRYINQSTTSTSSTTASKEYELILYTRSDLIWGNNFWEYFDNGSHIINHNNITLIQTNDFNFNNSNNSNSNNTIQLSLPSVQSSNILTYKNIFKVWISNLDHYFGGMSDRFMIMTHSFFRYYTDNFEEKLMNYLNPPPHPQYKPIHHNAIINDTLDSCNASVNILQLNGQFVYTGHHASGESIYRTNFVHGENINRFFLTRFNYTYNNNNTSINTITNHIITTYNLNYCDIIQQINICYGVLRHDCTFVFYGEKNCQSLNIPMVKQQFAQPVNYSRYATCKHLHSNYVKHNHTNHHNSTHLNHTLGN